METYSMFAFARPAMKHAGEYVALTKPRVITLIVFCAFIGMLLAPVERLALGTVLAATIGIALVAGAAAALNCLIEQKIDAVMARTRARPLPRGVLSSSATLLWSVGLCATGLGILLWWVNPLTAWLTLATFLGYAIVYTVILKPLTPQNIVIGGLSGAMPPVLGWAAVTGSVSGEAWLLALIIFVWTPPHFWALALYRTREYAAAGIPMLPVTHGSQYTRLHIFLYTWLLTAVTLMPFVIRMSGWLYLLVAVVLDGIFLVYTWQLMQKYSEQAAKKTFRYSIFYLSALFSALLLDHYLV
ncbi:MAG: protoheme IX farnesyltransferase [Betaproteobacteria bacterium]|nr:protoheme IX farnesyltransferase [Betaproteobacteria bacterium]